MASEKVDFISGLGLGLQMLKSLVQGTEAHGGTANDVRKLLDEHGRSADDLGKALANETGTIVVLDIKELRFPVTLDADISARDFTRKITHDFCCGRVTSRYEWWQRMLANDIRDMADGALAAYSRVLRFVSIVATEEGDSTPSQIVSEQVLQVLERRKLEQCSLFEILSFAMQYPFVQRLMPYGWYHSNFRFWLNAKGGTSNRVYFEPHESVFYPHGPRVCLVRET